MIYLIFCLHVRRYPSNPVAWFVGEEGSTNDQVVVSTVVGKEFSVLVHHSKAMLTITCSAIAANLCIFSWFPLALGRKLIFPPPLLH